MSLLCLQRLELDADRERLHSEFEGLVGKQQERAAEWEAAAQEEEAGIAHRKQVSSCCRCGCPCCCYFLVDAIWPVPCQGAPNCSCQHALCAAAAV